MCIAFYAPPGTTIDRATLSRCFDSNPHGAGFIIPDPMGPKVKKGFFEFNQWADAISHSLRRNKHGVIGHCRIATHGNIDEVNCHPHVIESHNSAFVHNGSITQHCDAKSEFSDSILFGRDVLAYLPKNWNEVIGAREHLESYIGKYNKIIYAFDNGHVEIINKDSGIWSGGVWYSNRSFEEQYFKREYIQDFGFCELCNLDLKEDEKSACDELCLPNYFCSHCVPSQFSEEYENFVFEFNFENDWERYENEKYK